MKKYGSFFEVIEWRNVPQSIIFLTYFLSVSCMRFGLTNSFFNYGSWNESDGYSTNILYLE